MSYAVIDSTGSAADIATSQGLDDLEALAGPKLAAFLETGEADEDLAKEIVTEVKDDDRTSYIADLFGGAAPFVLSNGIEEDNEDADGEKYSDDQPRDESGRWSAGGGGASDSGGGETLDQRLVDYNPDRSLSDPAKVEAISTLVQGSANAEYVAYSQMPFIDSLHREMGVDDPLAIPVADYIAKRKEFFASLPESSVSLEDVVVTQQYVNQDRIQEIRDKPETAGTKPLYFVSYNSKTYVINGHHRIVSAILDGNRSISGNVWNAGGQKYADDQPRDESGRWTDAGGGDSSSSESAGAATELFTGAARVEPSITQTMKNVIALNGGDIKGLEHRIKTEASLARKILDDANNKKITAQEAAAQINDALRYTGVFENDKFSAGAERTLTDLRAAGYEVTRVKNFWGGTTYQGTNVKMTSPDGQVFELQFHTPASFDLKIGKSHALYQKMRTTKSPAARARYGAELTALWTAITSPLNWERLKSE